MEQRQIIAVGGSGPGCGKSAMCDFLAELSGAQVRVEWKMPVDEGMLRSTLRHSLLLLRLRSRILSIANTGLAKTHQGDLKLNAQIRAEISTLAAEVYLLTDFVEQLRQAGVKE